ncbi:hypothetical protein ACGFR8_31210 [Streptomyces brevispora]|uniref:hypothetical protein n=1 Tax=Streptomyces brevispora TaxID=887462 RepID=UPI003720AD49
MPGITAPQRERRSRKPTGLPNPPLMLLVGPEKSGKSYEAALGTSSDLIGTTYWIEIGGSEGTADYYGRIRGARYEIVEHNGTYQDILDAVRWAIAQPPVNGKQNMIVVDNGSNLWDMLSDEQALFARRRAVQKAQRNRQRSPGLDDPVVIDSDLWNRAKDRWGEFLWLLRRHSGPTLLLARQELVTAFENDKPTRDKTRKIKAEKNLPAAVDAIVELHTFGEAHLTGVRTLHWDVKPGESVGFPDFSVDTLLRRLGYEDAATSRQVIESRPEAYLQEQEQRQEQRQGQGQGQGQQRQQRTSAETAVAPPALSGKQAVDLIHKAHTNESDPEACLHALREEWGFRTLQQIPTKTNMWGERNADDLITVCLTHIKEEAAKRKLTTKGNQPTEPTAAPAPPGKAEPAREHSEPSSTAQTTVRPQAEQPPLDEHEAPPPPDPQAEEPSPAETPEETSAAEEPQDLPAPPPTKSSQPRKRAAPKSMRADDPKAIARQALRDEAEVQARVKFVTVGEHLGPIEEAGDPGLGELRDFVQQHRAEVIALLEEADEGDLAEVYRRAPMPDLGIKQKFAQYLDGARAER